MRARKRFTDIRTGEREPKRVRALLDIVELSLGPNEQYEYQWLRHHLKDRVAGKHRKVLELHVTIEKVRGR